MTSLKIDTVSVSVEQISRQVKPQQQSPVDKPGFQGILQNFSASGDVFDAVDSFFDLGRQGRFEGLRSLGKEDRQQFYRIVGTLLKNGYMGYETLKVGKKIERHDVLLQIGDERLKGAKPYRNPDKH